MDNLKIKSLSINLESFGFISRETRNDKIVKNRCGRDFFYYALQYFNPEIYNPQKVSPLQIEDTGVFGLTLPMWLIWTGLSFYKIPKILNTLKLELEVNDKKIKNFGQFFVSLLPFRPQSFEEGICLIKSSVDNHYACGIDISIALGGLVDHVMFVYGYDNENLYIFDTHQVDRINYEKMTSLSDLRFIMKLPYSEIKKKWTIFNRVWVIKKDKTIHPSFSKVPFQKRK